MDSPRLIFNKDVISLVSHSHLANAHKGFCALAYTFLNTLCLYYLDALCYSYLNNGSLLLLLARRLFGHIYLTAKNQ